MRVSKLAVLVLTASLSGCVWYHPTKNERQFNQDQYMCTLQSAQAFPTVMRQQTYGADISHTTCQRSSIGFSGSIDCSTMAAPSYTSDVNQGNRDSAFRSCMSANGWSLRWK